MQIELQQLGKRFNQHWIFRDLSYSFKTGEPVAIIGPNGSGKSTLLQVIAGIAEKSEGKINWMHDEKPVPTEAHYRLLSFTAPYLELIEELTLSEFLEFHQAFKPLLPGYSIPQIIQYVNLEQASNKQVRLFSSGMKQRVKLAQAFFSNVPVVMLDEPTSNLDVDGIALYKKMVNELTSNRLLIVCSNEEQEIDFCKHRLNLMEHKPVFA